MRSKRSWAWAGLGASSLLAFLTACGDVNEDFKIIVVTPDAGQDAAPEDDATVPDGSADAAADATSDATMPDGSVQDAQIDAGVDAGLVVPDGGSIVIVGDAAVVIPPLDPGLLGGADGGIVISDGGLANADGGALAPRQFRDLVNGITCQRISECCCPGCSASEQAQVVSPTKCANGFGANGLSFSLFANEAIPTTNLVYDGAVAARCLSLLNSALSSCRSLSADSLLTFRTVCLGTFQSSQRIGDQCANVADCAGAAVCRTNVGGQTCAPAANIGAACTNSLDCSARGVSGNPAAYCATTDAGRSCAAYLPVGSECPFDIACGAGVCIPDSLGVKRCSNVLPFASAADPSSYCVQFSP